MKNVINTTIDRLAAALAIEGREDSRVWCEDEGVYEYDEVLYLVKPAVKPVSGKSLAWMLSHGGAEWLEFIGFAPAVLDAPVFNPSRKYVVFVDADGYYTFHRYSDYSGWEY